MFGKKKVLHNDVFGDMKYWGVEWNSDAKIAINLWNREYEVRLGVVAKKEADGISEIQEKAYSDFKETIIARQREIETIIEDYYQTHDTQVLISKFTPTELQISTRGECAILADNADDEDMHDPLPGLAVVVSPKVALFTQEEYAGYVFSGSYFVELELYGKEWQG